MCGLYALFGPHPPHLEDLPLLDGWPNFTDHYRIPPSSLAPVIRQAPDGRRAADLLKWGLIPHWAKDETIGRKLINARGETVAEKPSFRSAYRKRRCIVPASGFYEWRQVAGQKWKQPYYISLRNGELMGMGGLWESWTSPEGEIVRTYCIITTAANDIMAPIHDRMPVILKPDTWKAWLEPDADPRTIAPLVAPLPSEAMQVWPVSRQVSKARDDDRSLIAPVDIAAT
jgi:putative SOS response-associated peptidase YedK